MKHQDALAQLARETKRAKSRMALERALRVSVWLVAAIGVWALIALGGLHARLPLLVQSVTALIAVLGFVVLAARARQQWRAPTEQEARARLAYDSQLEISAFDSLRDQPSKYDPFSIALWKREQDLAVERAENARAGPPRPGLDDVDPFKLRYGLVVLLVVAAFFAGPAAPDRLAQAFMPDPGPLLGDQPMQIEAWVAPADYTSEAPVSLSDRVGETLATPPSIEATVRVTGPVGAPLLVYQGEGGRRTQRFELAPDGAWEARLAIPGAGRLKIVRFHTRAQWRLNPAADEAPLAAFSAPIATLNDETVNVAWRARDDYGVRRMLLRVRPVSPPPGLVQAGAIDTEIETPAGDPREAEGESEVDLGMHPYAGMEVQAQIVAVDALGQEGVSETLRFTMPEKIFLQPLARAAIEIRRHILAERRAYRPAREERRRTMPAGDILTGTEEIEVRDLDRVPQLRRAPAGIVRAARLLDSLTMEPRDGYFRDLAVYLGLRTARSELAVARSIEETNIAADILWRVALRAEYGGAADARRALEEAQRALAEAIANNAPQERINQLMEALRNATERYMQALVQEAMRSGERQQSMEDTQDQAQLTERDIQELMQRIQEATEQGRQQEAQQLLQMLSQILANLDVQLSEGGQGEGEEGEQNQQLQQSLDQLSETMGDQRALNDETEQRQQQQQSQGGSGGQQQGGQGGQDLADRQSQIQNSLTEVQRMAEDSGAAQSQSLNDAQQAMRRAEDALRRGDLEGAEAAQDAALENLREGAEQLGAEMRERGREGGREQGEQGQSGNRDPLGRPNGGADGQGNVPTTSDPVRAREIYDEIRRRAQDPNRPEAEREYLRRLMDRFGDS